MVLKFKNGGDVRDYKKSRKKRKVSSSQAGAKTVEGKKGSSRGGDGDDHDETVTKASREGSSGASASPVAPVMKKLKGSGTVAVSGSIVTGRSTSFKSQIRPGDAVILRNPSSGKDEMRVVTAVVSDTSLSVSSTFPFGGGSGFDYWFVNRPRHGDDAKDRDGLREGSLQEATDKACGVSKDGVVEIRVKNNSGGYKIIKEMVGEGLNREDMIEMRSKRKSDKYC